MSNTLIFSIDVLRPSWPGVERAARIAMGRGPGGPESPEQGTADGAVSGGVRRCDRAQDACTTLYYMCATAVSVWW